MEQDFDFNNIYRNILRRAYRCIGMGSGRVVFDLGNGYVVKAARNQRGIAQNEAEFRIASADDSGLFAGIPAVSDRFWYLIMEKAGRLRNIAFVWRFFNVGSNQELFQVQKLKDISAKHDLVLVDLGRSVNWGQIDGKPIIIDYGFTRDVRRRYYLPPFFRRLQC